jgi:hypothetical protein
MLSAGQAYGLPGGLQMALPAGGGQQGVGLVQLMAPQQAGGEAQGVACGGAGSGGLVMVAKPPDGQALVGLQQFGSGGGSAAGAGGVMEPPGLLLAPGAGAPGSTLAALGGAPQASPGDTAQQPGYVWGPVLGLLQ